MNAIRRRSQPARQRGRRTQPDKRATAQRVKVEPEVSSYPGQTVNLRCAFTDATGIQLTMPKDGERTNIAVLHPKFAPNYPESPVKGRVSFSQDPPDLGTPSIQIRDVRMTDEGRYICEYATYPIGNEQGVTQLIMLAKPQNSASIVTVNAGTKPDVVARCESVDGRPAAKISWVTTANGNGTTLSKPGVGDTVTVTSEYSIIPTAADNGKDISCVVAHRTQTKPESFPMKLVVQYAPQVTIVGYDNNWYVGRTNVMLTCQANSNPVPISVQWKTMTGELPDTVQIKDNELKVLKVDETVNTTFVCEVRNRIGTSREQVAIFVRVPCGATACVTTPLGPLFAAAYRPPPPSFPLLSYSLAEEEEDNIALSEPIQCRRGGRSCDWLPAGLLLVVALICVLVTHSRRQQQGYRANGGSDMKTRIFGGGKKASKNGTGGGAGSGGVGGSNNNGPIYVYNESSSHQALGEKNNHHQPLTMGGRPEVVATTPTAQDILLSSELDDAERRKFDELEEEERYDHFTGGAPILQLRPHNDQDDIIGDYLDDDMESQRDGSVISRTAVYV
ncbi:hypothetical protein INR49_001605 [Caranx melampygus]|nr:hypothetical protein INR49_001605 [Caranx melampygus]